MLTRALAICSCVFLAGATLILTSCNTSDSVSAHAVNPQKTPQHLELQQRIGTWQGTVTAPLADGGEAQHAASEEVHAHGEYFVWSNWVSERSEGQNYLGRGTYGYDPAKGKYVETWINNFNPQITIKEGNFDTEKNALVVRWTELDENGKPVAHRSEETRQANSYTKNYFKNDTLYAAIKMQRVSEATEPE